MVYIEDCSPRRLYFERGKDVGILQQARPRKSPFVWSTWLNRLFAGESHCQWAVWFRAHHLYDKTSPDSANMRRWTLAHTSLVDATAAKLERDGYTVLVEGQNRFSLESASGVTLAGCPDIVAEGEDEIIVIDCKTGKPRLSHEYKVMTYMLCLPHVSGRYKLKTVYGRVQYPDDSAHISPDSLDEDFKRYFRELMQLVGGPVPPRKVPSVDDCRFCDIAATYCPERSEFDLSSTSPRVDLF